MRLEAQTTAGSQKLHYQLSILNHSLSPFREGNINSKFHSITQATEKHLDDFYPFLNIKK